MQTMVRIREIALTFAVFCIALTAIDLALLLVHASSWQLMGAGLLLTPPTVYRVIRLMDGVEIGKWLRRGRRKEEPRLHRPIH